MTTATAPLFPSCTMVAVSGRPSSKTGGADTFGLDICVDDCGCSNDPDDAVLPSIEFLSSDTSVSTETTELIEIPPSTRSFQKTLSEPVSRIEQLPSTQSFKKSVSFGNLVALEFAVEKGDPSIYEMAYPLQLGSNVLEHASFPSIDDYEAQREYLPRRSNELKTSNSEERRQIIKQSKKLEKEAQRRHRRRNSIGNGQISRLAAMLGVVKKEELVTNVESQCKRLMELPPRPPLRRENSIGNGQISRDKRRNRVQEFLKRMSKN